MGFKVSIEANEKIELGLETVTSVIFDTDTPDDSNARSTDLGMGITIKGKIRANIGGIADDSSCICPYTCRERKVLCKRIR